MDQMQPQGPGDSKATAFREIHPNGECLLNGFKVHVAAKSGGSMPRVVTKCPSLRARESEARARSPQEA